MPIVRSGYAVQRRRAGSSRRVQAIRAAVVARARVCAYCEQPPTASDPLEAAHVIAYGDGGADEDVRNYVAAHRSCNRKRGRL
jgi:5-methylcytosine-specific restriction endonuclease McrA